MLSSRIVFVTRARTLPNFVGEYGWVEGVKLPKAKGGWLFERQIADEEVTDWMREHHRAEINRFDRPSGRRSHF